MSYHETIADAFAGTNAFRTTGVRVVLVVIDKPRVPHEEETDAEYSKKYSKGVVIGYYPESDESFVEEYKGVSVAEAVERAKEAMGPDGIVVSVVSHFRGELWVEKSRSELVDEQDAGGLADGK